MHILQAVFLVLFSIGALFAPPPQEANTIGPSDLINAINSARVAYGLPALEIDPILMATAQSTAEVMALNNIRGHIGDVKGRVMAAGYGGGSDAWATENWAMGPLTIDQLMSGPWADDSHMIPVVNPNYRHIGAGVAEYNGNVYYIVHAAYTSGGSYKPLPTTEGGSAPVIPSVPQIIMPVETATVAPDGSLVHIVQPGQSLWAIAIAYHTHIVDVQRLNGMAATNNSIYIGQKLNIPTGANLVAPTPSDPAERTAVAQMAAGTATPDPNLPTATIGTPQPTHRPTRTPMPRFTATSSDVAVAQVDAAQPPAATSPAAPIDRWMLIALGAAFGLGLLLVISGTIIKRSHH